MPDFSLLTLNTHWGFDLLNRRPVLAELREAIRGVAADLVFLQETGETSRLVHGGLHGAQHEFLADTLWPQFAYGRNAVFPHGHLGNALLSKFPIEYHANRDVSLPGHEPRGLLHAVIATPMGPLHAICVHLGLREHHRQRQLDLLCALVRDEIPHEAPLVVAGDFNDWRRRGHPLLAECGLREAFLDTGGRLARTFPARFPLMPVDRVYLRNLRVVRARVLSMPPWRTLSDHVPLLVTARR